MTIKQLIKILNAEKDKNLELVMSKDGEGNGFSPLADVGDGLYIADSTWSGQVFNLNETEEADSAAGSEKTKVKKVLVLWPTN